MKRYIYFSVTFISFIACFYVSEVLVDEGKSKYIIAQAVAANDHEEDDFPWGLFLPAFIKKRTSPIDPLDEDNDFDGYTENQGDCNDTNVSIHPGATEICEDGFDQDCNGSDLACPVDPIFAKTELLKGSWYFWYIILTPFDNYYYLTTISGDKNDEGGYYIFGTSGYGDPVGASYYPDSKWRYNRKLCLRG